MESDSDPLAPSRDRGEELDEDRWNDWEDCSVSRDYSDIINGRRYNVCREERAKIVDRALEIRGDRFHLQRRNGWWLRLFLTQSVDPTRSSVTGAGLENKFCTSLSMSIFCRNKESSGVPAKLSFRLFVSTIYGCADHRNTYGR